MEDVGEEYVKTSVYTQYLLIIYGKEICNNFNYYGE